MAKIYYVDSINDSSLLNEASPTISKLISGNYILNGDTYTYSSISMDYEDPSTSMYPISSDLGTNADSISFASLAEDSGNTIAVVCNNHASMSPGSLYNNIYLSTSYEYFETLGKDISVYVIIPCYINNGYCYTTSDTTSDLGDVSIYNGLYNNTSIKLTRSYYNTDTYQYQLYSCYPSSSSSGMTGPGIIVTNQSYYGGVIMPHSFNISGSILKSKAYKNYKTAFYSSNLSYMYVPVYIIKCKTTGLITSISNTGLSFNQNALQCECTGVSGVTLIKFKIQQKPWTPSPSVANPWSMLTGGITGRNGDDLSADGGTTSIRTYFTDVTNYPGGSNGLILKISNFDVVDSGTGAINNFTSSAPFDVSIRNTASYPVTAGTLDYNQNKSAESINIGTGTLTGYYYLPYTSGKTDVSAGAGTRYFNWGLILNESEGVNNEIVTDEDKFFNQAGAGAAASYFPQSADTDFSGYPVSTDTSLRLSGAGNWNLYIKGVYQGSAPSGSTTPSSITRGVYFDRDGTKHVPSSSIISDTSIYEAVTVQYGNSTISSTDSYGRKYISINTASTTVKDNVKITSFGAIDALSKTSDIYIVLEAVNVDTSGSETGVVGNFVFTLSPTGSYIWSVSQSEGTANPYGNTDKTIYVTSSYNKFRFSSIDSGSTLYNGGSIVNTSSYYNASGTQFEFNVQMQPNYSFSETTRTYILEHTDYIGVTGTETVSIVQAAGSLSLTYDDQESTGGSKYAFSNNGGDAVFNITSTAPWKVVSITGDASVTYNRDQGGSSTAETTVSYKFQINKNSDPTSNKTATLLVAFLNGSTVVTSAELSENVIQSSGETVNSFEILQSNGTVINPGSVAYTGIDKNEGDFTFKIHNTGNIQTSYKVTVTPSTCYVSNSTPSIAASGTVTETLTVTANPNASTRTISVTVAQSDDTTKSITFSVTQSAGTYGINLATNTSYKNTNPDYNLNSEFYQFAVQNIGSVDSAYRIYSDSEWCKISSDSVAATNTIMTGTVTKNCYAPSGTTSINSKWYKLSVDENTSTESRVAYITIEDVNSPTLYNTRITITQQGWPEPTFDVSIWYGSASNKTYVAYGEHINNRNLYATYVWDSTAAGNRAHFSAVSENTTYVSVSNSSISGVTINITANQSNTTQEAIPISIDFNGYYTNNPSSTMYSAGRPFTKTFLYYIRSEAPVSIANLRGGEYFRNISGVGDCYVFGPGYNAPGYGIRSTTITDENGGKCNWTVSKTGTGVSAVMAPTNSVSSGTLYINCGETGTGQIGSVSVSATNTVSGLSSSDGPVNIYRYPKPSFSGSFTTNSSKILTVNAAEFRNGTTYNDSITRQFTATYDKDLVVASYSVLGDDGFYVSLNTESGNTQTYDVIINKNISTSKTKRCTIRFTYNYNDSIPDHTEDLVYDYTIEVNPAPVPNIAVLFEDGNPGETSHMYSYYYGKDGATCKIDVDVDSASVANPYPVSWEFSDEEIGTTGNEFSLSRFTEGSVSGFKSSIPTNTSVGSAKVTNITLMYYYTGSSTSDTIQSKSLTITVEKAAEPTFDASGFMNVSCNYANTNPTLNIDILSDGNMLPITWSYSTTEINTTGSEFSLYRESDSSMKLSIPTNPTKSDKICNVVYTYNYVNASDSIGFNKKYSCTVTAAGSPELTATPVLPSEVTSTNSIPYYFGESVDASIPINVVISSNNKLDVEWNVTLSETGTTGNEFSVIYTTEKNTAPGTTTTIYVKPPINTSTTVIKTCVLKIAYNFQGSSSSTGSKEITINFGVNVADAPTFEVTGLIDASCDYSLRDGLENPIVWTVNTAANKLPVSWDFETKESGTTGDEFTVIPVGNTALNLSIPSNPNETAKVCIVKFTYYYSDSTSKNYVTREFTVRPSNVPSMNITDVVSSVEGEVPEIGNIPCNYSSVNEDGSICFNLDNTTDNIIPLTWSYTVSESGTTGNEFVVVKDSSMCLKVYVPINGTSVNKTCLVTFTYKYLNAVNESRTQTVIKNILVKPAGDPIFDISCTGVDDMSKIPGNYRYNSGTNDGSIKIVINTADNKIPVRWTYAIKESGTSGNEFSVVDEGDGTLYLYVPNNPTTDKNKYASLTFTYYYEGATDHSYDKTKIINFTVLPVNEPEIKLTVTTKNDVSISSIPCNYGLDGSVDIKIEITGDLPYTWIYSDEEAGTEGNEFNVIKSDSDMLNVSIPINASTSNTKSCTLNLTYYYSELSDTAYYKNEAVKMVVSTAPSIDFKVDIITENGEDYTKLPYYYGADSSISIKISGDNPLPISWYYVDEESGTSGNEFVLSKSDASTLLMTVPTNTSLITHKSCLLTFTYYYSGASSHAYDQTAIYKVDVDTAEKPTISIDPSTKSWPGIHASTDLDINVIINDVKLPVTWEYEITESGTSGNEFTAYPDEANSILILQNIPENDSLDTIKKCSIKFKCYYSSSTDHVNDNTATGVYTVNSIKGPVISFDPDSTLDNPVLQYDASYSEDASSYTILVYSISDPSGVYESVNHLTLDSEYVTYNGTNIGQFESTTIYPVTSDSSVFEIKLNMFDSVIDEVAFDTIYVSSYDRYNHSGLTGILNIKQNPKVDYCPVIKTSSASVTVHSNDSYYNVGFSKYITDGNYTHADTDNYVVKNNYSHINDVGFMIKPVDSGTWITIWYSTAAYKNTIIFEEVVDNSIYYTVSVPYTSSLIQITPGKKYEYKAVAKVDYRDGKSAESEWITGATICGDVRTFKIYNYQEEDLEYIRPYFKPVEKINGYLTGTEIKNFINSKGVVFNRKKMSTIDISDWQDNCTVVGKSATFNISGAFINKVLHMNSFNSAWSYIKDSANLVNAKKLYIKNNILSNVIINDKCKIEIYYDPESTSRGLVSTYNGRYMKVENSSNSIAYSSETDTYTMNITLDENKKYYVVLHLLY